MRLRRILGLERPRLILHAGTHKTGTTTIQEALRRYRRDLRRQGFVYPKVRGVVPNESLMHHQFARMLTGVRPDDDLLARRYATRLRRAAVFGHTILISSETIYRRVRGHENLHDHRRDDYWDLRRQYLMHMADVLGNFDIEVMICFRETDSFARSLFYGGELHQNWDGDFDAWRAAYSPWFDYDAQLDLFREVFGRVRTWDFETARRDGIVTTFAELIGCRLPAEADLIHERRTTYIDRRAL